MGRGKGRGWKGDEVGRERRGKGEGLGRDGEGWKGEEVRGR